MAPEPTPTREAARTGAAQVATTHGAPGGVVVLLSAAVVLFVAACGLAMASSSPPYSWHHSMISDLGSTSCVHRSGQRLCSPRAVVFNVGIVASGLCAVPAGWFLRRWRGRWVSAAVIVLGVGLVMLGVVTSDMSRAAHMAGAVLALPIPAALLVVAAVTGRGRHSWDVWTSAAAGIVTLVACLDQLTSDERAPVPHGVAELVSVAALMAFLVAQAVTLVTARGAGRRG